MKHVAAALAILLAAGHAGADEPRTLRIGITGPLNSLLYYHESSPATALVTEAVFDTLIHFDERQGRMVPLIAREWRRIDERTLDFDLRDDVKWHDGVALDADDVLYTINWLGDDATRLHMQHKWGWIDHAEKLGRHKVRLVAKRPTPEALARLATVVAMLPEHKHGMLLDDRRYFGRDPIGSGPYRGRVDEHGGIVLHRAASYAHGNAVKTPANVERIAMKGWIVPGEALAAFRSGALDVVLDAAAEDAKPVQGAALTTVAGYGTLVLSFGARTGPLADADVRGALLGAIDRAEIAALAPGARTPESLCWREQAGCGPPAIAPARTASSKAAGMSIVLAAQGPHARAAAEIVARRWQILGVSTRVETVSPEQLYMRQRDGELQAAVFGWHAGEMPDVAETVATFLATGFWDRHGDPVLHALAGQSDRAHDDRTRRDIVRRALEHWDGRAYGAAIGPYPASVLHRPEVAVDARGRLGALGITLFDLRWR